MKRLILVLACVVSSGVRLAAEETKPVPPLRLVVSLSDGSRVLGEPSLTGVALETESLGKLEIPLAKLRGIKFADSREATLALANGDKLQGRLVNRELALQTLFGAVTIPVALAREIQVTSRPAAGAEVRDGLVAWYPFNGDANDQSGNENHGRLVGAKFVDSGTGKALRVEGNTGSFVVIKRTAAIEPADAITISFWLKGTAGENYATLLRKADHCGSGYLIRGNGQASAQFSGQNPCAVNYAYVVLGGYDPERWQHWVTTFSSTDELVKTYCNGEMAGKVAQSGPLHHSGELYLGGASADGLDGGFKGLISDVRIYNRALTADEIAALHNSGCPVGD